MTVALILSLVFGIAVETLDSQRQNIFCARQAVLG
jgi:hypothetical protein